MLFVAVPRALLLLLLLPAKAAGASAEALQRGQQWQQRKDGEATRGGKGAWAAQMSTGVVAGAALTRLPFAW
jgi:hypothetical protein